MVLVSMHMFLQARVVQLRLYMSRPDSPCHAIGTRYCLRVYASSAFAAVFP